MKKILILLLVLIFSVGMVYMGISCKEETAPAEEEAAPAEEETAPAEEEAAPAEEEAEAEEEVAEEEVLPPMEERTPLEFWYNATSPEAFITLFQKFSDDVWPLEIINIPGPMEEPILTKWAAGERPDIIDFHAELKWFYQLNPEKNLIDLSDMEFVERTKYNMLENSIGCIGPQGEVWGPVIIPQNYMAVIYNKLIFEELNLSIPKDATEFTALCQKIKDAGYTPMYSAAQDAWPTQIEHHCLMADMIKAVEESTGNRWWDEINAGVRDFDDGTSRPIIDLIISWIEAGYYQEDLATGTYEKSMSAIMNGDVTMVWNGQWMLATLVDSFGLEEVNKTIGMYGLSMNSNTTVGVIGSPGATYSVPKTGDPITEQGAKEFIKWITGSEPYGEAYQEFVNSMNVVAVIEGFEDGEIATDALKEIIDYGKKSSYGLWQSGLAVTPGPNEKNWQQVFLGVWDADDWINSCNDTFAENAKMADLPGWEDE